MSNLRDIRRWARRHFQELSQEEFEKRGVRLAARLLGYDDVANLRGQVFLAPSLRKALEAVIA